MPQSDLKIVGSSGIVPRIALVAAIIVALAFGWFAVRMQFGDMIAELTTAGSPSAEQMADIAHGMAPSDPLTMWLKATLANNVFTPENTASSVGMFEDTVRLAPRDFRWWIELGRAYEQDEKPVQAEAAFKKAIELGPTYTFPRWQLGNFYLRQGRTDEAFAELKLATKNNQTYREQVFSLAWEYFDKDPAKLEQIAADSPDVHASLALFYAQRGRAADSLRNWDMLTDEQKAQNPQIFRTIAQGLYDKRSYPEALEFARQLGIDPDAKPETVTNAGFEKTIGNAEDTRFGWRVMRNDAKVDVATDSIVRHDGARSLRIFFKAYNKPELYIVTQNVVAVPGRSYRLRFWLRTENLRSAGMPQLQIVNANDDTMLAKSQSYPNGTNDWEQVSVEFTAPENCSGIVIRTIRASCGPDCPIAGTIWYDDFELKRTN